MADPVRKRLEQYDDLHSGLDYPVRLIGGVEVDLDPVTGDELGHVFPNPDGLTAAIALARILTPVRLAPAELKFLRKSLDLTSKAMARLLGMAPETYSRIETGKQPLADAAERALRLLAAAELSERAPAIDYRPSVITGMAPAKAWPDGDGPRLVIRHVRLKDAGSRRITDQWDRVPPGRMAA